MISSNNSPSNTAPLDDDFTLKSYSEILTLAKENYIFSNYDSIPWGQRFILWRHDCDYSLNRGHALALLEASQGISATYFLNLHSEFYNLFELSQYRIVLDIIKMGHQIGLHFDASFHETQDEKDLSKKVHAEAVILEGIFGVRPIAFSFHNPLAKHLSFDAEIYGGLVNCYSRRFKEEVPYCSDSNGYWRFRRLKDVLTMAADPCLQVLTHPGWWQDSPMPPRQRIFRSVYGRAESILCQYDLSLKAHDRQNHGVDAGRLQFLKYTQPQLFNLFDYLWNKGYFQPLFAELWRLHLGQIIKLCKTELLNTWSFSTVAINALLDDFSLTSDKHQLFKSVFEKDWCEAANVNLDDYEKFSNIYETIVQGCLPTELKLIEDGCIFLCTAIESLTKWGQEQLVNCDGINKKESIKTLEKNIMYDNYKNNKSQIFENEISPNSSKKWMKLKADLSKLRTGGGNQ